MRLNIYVLISSLVYSMFLSQLCGAQLDSQQQNVIKIGLIVDMGSSMGKVVQSCVDMAISDANALHRENGTWIVLQPMDSKGEPFTAITAAKHLLKSIKVEAIIVPEMTSEAWMMAALGDKANVPMLSFTSVPFSIPHPYFLQITEEENIQFNGIIAFLEAFESRNITLIHDTDDDGRNILPHILEEFQEKNIHVIYKNFISLSVEDDQIIEELQKLKMMQTSFFVVHTKPSLASKIFLNAKRLGMMSEGYAWLVTSKTMNFLDTLDPLVIESMQGAVGLKSYIPASSKLQNFTLKWKKKVQNVDPNLEVTGLNVLGIRAYDTIWALANSFAGLGTKLNFTSSEFLEEILKSEFTGLSGDFQFKNGKLVFKGYEVVNVIGKGERRVGFWTLANGLTKEISDQNQGLETIIWPGISTTAPKSWLFQTNGKRLQIAFPVKQGFHELISMQHDIQNNVTIVTGFCKDVFDAAIKRLGYDVPYDLVPFKDTKNGQMHGSYEDLAYQVFLKNYDGAIGDLTITSNRSLYVDFSIPFTDLGVGTVVRVDRKNKWFFLKPFDTDLWITVACSFILLGVIIWLLEHPVNKEFQGSPPQQIATIFGFSASTLVYAHRESLQNNLSKVVMGVWLFVVFILASSYTAILSSILTVQQIQLANGDQIGYQAYSSVRGVLNFTDNRLERYLTSEEYNDALSRGSENGGVGAIIDEIPYIKIFLAKYPSDHVMIDTSQTTNGFGFAFQKGSPLVHEISKAIVKLREDGELLELEKKWFDRVNTNSGLLSEDYELSNPKSLSLENFLGLFFISGLSKFIALLIFLIFFLREKLSLKHCILRVLVEGKFAFFGKYLFPRIKNAIGETAH